MGALPDFSGARILARNSGGSRGVEGTTEAAVDGQRLRNRWRQLGQCQPRADYLSPARGALEDYARRESACRIDGNCSDRMPRSGCGCDEVQGLSRHGAADGNDRVARNDWRSERQTQDGSGVRARGRDGQAGSLGAKRCGECGECSYCIGASSQESSVYQGWPAQANL